MGVEILAALVAAAASSTAVMGLVRAFIRRDTGDSAHASIDDHEVDEVLAALRNKLTEAGGAGGGSDQRPATAPTPGELEARVIMDLYGKDLIAEAKRIAKRANAERPSKGHVRQAADRIGILRDRAGVASDLALALGSILIGGAVAFQVNLWTGGEANDGIGLWVAVGLATGVGIVVAAGTIKWRRT